MNPLVALLIKDLLIPEIAEFVKRQQEAGKPVDEAVLRAEFDTRIDRIVGVGETWLSTHPT